MKKGGYRERWKFIFKLHEKKGYLERDTGEAVKGKDRCRWSIDDFKDIFNNY